jgi:hypothetical protein
MPPNRQHATMKIGWPLDSRTMAYLISLKSVIAGPVCTKEECIQRKESGAQWVICK